MTKPHLVPQAITDKNGVQRIYYINPDNPNDFEVISYEGGFDKEVYRNAPARMTKTISFFDDEQGRTLLKVDGDNGEDIVFEPSELEDLDDAVADKIDRNIRDGLIYQHGNISILLFDGKDETPEDDTVIIRDNRTGRKIRIDWSDIRILSRKTTLLLEAMARSRKKIPANQIKAGDIIDLLPEITEAYNNLDPSQLDSEQGVMLAELIAEAQESYFVIEEVKTFNDSITLYTTTGKQWEVDYGHIIAVESHDIRYSAEWHSYDEYYDY